MLKIYILSTITDQYFPVIQGTSLNTNHPNLDVMGLFYGVYDPHTAQRKPNAKVHEFYLQTRIVNVVTLMRIYGPYNGGNLLLIVQQQVYDSGGHWQAYVTDMA